MMNPLVLAFRFVQAMNDCNSPKHDTAMMNTQSSSLTDDDFANL
jgi:hypothetical protein